MIVYTDLPELGKQFKLMRSHFSENMTVVFMVQQDDFWAFQIQSKIENIFKQEGYPKNYPETVYPEYSSAMHVKYELIEKVVKEKLVNTKYLAWIDIGYFRSEQKDISTLEPPNGFKDDHIAYLQKFRYKKEATARDIVYGAMIFLAGGLFVGRPEYLLLMVKDYQHAVKEMIEMNIMASDEQVLYFMYSQQTSCNVRVPVQRYYNVDRMTLQSFRYLGWIMQENSLKRIRSHRSMLDQMLYTHTGGL